MLRPLATPPPRRRGPPPALCCSNICFCADDIYKPSLWYFDILQFLDDQDSAIPTRSRMDNDEEEPQQEVS
ncbi:hypothetical protein J6590_060602 [Homalodisca vitripennis]|nr:hypothetical protein J6590_060602 [Homalodisca vitripennis]